MHNYIYNQTEHNIAFNIDDIKPLLEKDKQDLLNSDHVADLNKHLGDILRGNKSISVLQNSIFEPIDEFILKIEEVWKKKTQGIRNDILNKYLQSKNLHILMSNGCSMYAGSKAINTNEKKEHSLLLEQFVLQTELSNKDEIEATVRSLANKRPEQALDVLYQLLAFYQNVLNTELGLQAFREFEEFIRKFKYVFIKNFVLTINYEINYLHKAFLKKLISRNEKLNKVNIFTLNYDLLIEKTAEELGIYVNNGFAGFHYRTFMPSTFHLDTHLNYTDGGKINTKGINLFKLHGSLSWEFDDSKPPYGITEKQQDFATLSNNERELLSIPECIIYPVQSKKTYSLDLPYSEMFRQFIEFVSKPNSTLIVMGYSFLDEHVNDIITNALSNPDFTLIVFSYQSSDSENLAPYLVNLIKRSKEDSRILIFFGNVLGDFEFIVRYLIPYPYDNHTEKVILETLKQLKGGKMSE
ncbi:SIR2 family protein [Thermaerobacillus caldiproteolyticus]|uniref:SIR2 family protein n=1 Tax=Thermaerobacillus caldiproteolyticus TaxID=247480 RepID=UPI0018F10D1F|nr:SIR2 family protein [Anoxybacillus caldiproteolyticus]